MPWVVSRPILGNGTPRGNNTIRGNNNGLGRRCRASLEVMPVEMVLEIMECLDVGDLLNLALTSKFFQAIFAEKRTQLLLKAVQKCPELEILLRVYLANERDFQNNKMLRPITVTFHFDTECAPENKVFLVHSPVHWAYGQIVCPEKIRLGPSDLLGIVGLVRVVDWWVDMYPQLRWRDNPEDRRRLRPEEQVRLRKALARWWLYGEYFHGVLPWYDARIPKRLHADVRLHHVRVLTTQEILELDDLLSTMWETVSKDLCSSPDKADDSTRFSVELIPWGQYDRHPAVVNTYLKLGPKLLKHFLAHCCYRFKKEHLIGAMASRIRGLVVHQETLSMSIATVLWERAELHPDVEEFNHHCPRDWFPRMGIVDEDRPAAEECAPFANDAWSSGYPPIGTVQESWPLGPLRPADRIPSGDDGADRRWVGVLRREC